MIDKALIFLEEQTELYFQGLMGASTQKYASLGNIAKVADSGVVTNDDENAGIIITLVNIEEDQISKNPNGAYRQLDKVIRTNPQIRINLYVLFSVNIPTYSTALGRISNVIKCFQSNNSFSNSAFPFLNPDIERLHMELYTMNFEQINYLWSTLGGKYLPSVLYRIKMIPIADDANYTEGRLITEIQLQKTIISGK